MDGPEPALSPTPLANVLACPHSSLPNEPTAGKPDTSHRRYAAAITTSIPVATGNDVAVHTVTYEVTMRKWDIASSLALSSEGVPRIDCAVPVPPALAEDFAGFARKYTNFSASFGYSNLAPLAELIASALALSTKYCVTSDSLRCGREMTVTALGAIASPVSAGLSSVFIPRTVETHTRPNTFAILAAAATGRGATVVTDALAADAGAAAPIVPTVGSDGFHRAAIDALILLGANMAALGAGGLFAYAVTRGIHRAVSVVAHSDEGGITRDILRSGEFSVPFGGIHFGLTGYTGLPTLTSATTSDVAGYIDSIALTTAAAVACADPGIDNQGVWMPTVLDNSIGPAQPGGSHVTSTSHAARALPGLVSSASAFAPTYLRAVARIFGFEDTHPLAVNHFNACASLITQHNRHLSFPSICPWFWIEPTSLIAPDLIDTPAVRNLAGPYGAPRRSAVHPAFPSAFPLGPSGGIESTAIVSLPFVRAAPLVAHLRGRVGDGLAYYRPTQLDPNGMIHPGPHSEHPLISDRLANGVDLAGYLWARGQTPLCAPGELLNVGNTMALTVQHYLFADGRFTSSVLPNGFASFDCDVTVTVATPVGIPAGPSNWATREARKARTAGLISLDMARETSRALGHAVVVRAPIIACAPAIPLRPATVLPARQVVHHGRSVSVTATAARPEVAEATPLDISEKRLATVPPAGMIGAVTVPPLTRTVAISSGSAHIRADDEAHHLRPEPAPTAGAEPAAPP